MAERYIEQPGNRTFKTRDGVQVVLEWNPNFANRRNGFYNRAQRYLDAQVLYKSEPYIPVRYGALIQSGRRFTRIGSGEVVWRSRDYARPVYYGRRAPGRRGPKVTRAYRWFSRMKRVSGANLVAEAKRLAGGGNG